MRKIIIVIVLFSIALSVHAQDRFVGRKADPSTFTVQRNIPFRTAGTLPLTFDLYRPAGNDVVPLVIVANIGSTAYGTWPVYIGWGEAFASAGLGAVVYQATRNTALEDFDAVMDVLRARASELRIDPTRVVIWAGSSNVRLGLPLAMDRKRDYIAGATIFYGDAEVAEIRSDLPVFFLRSGLDSTELNARIDQLLVKALAANAPWTIESYGGGLHGFEVLNDNEVSRELIARCVAFAKSVTRRELGAAYASTADDAAVGAAFARGDWAAAIEGYRRRTGPDSRDAESFRRLGLALLATKQYADALPAIERAWTLGRRGPRDTAYPAARAAALAGNVERSLHWLDVLLSSSFGPPVDEIRQSPDFAAVRDLPAFAQLLQSIDEQRRVEKLIDDGRIAEAARIVVAAKQGRFLKEAVVNTLAYRALANAQGPEVLELFIVNTKRHPQSANVWDSLSEAYERLGRRADAVSASRRVLSVLASDKSLDPTTRTNLQSTATARLTRLTAP